MLVNLRFLRYLGGSFWDPVAQSVEHLTFNQVAESSNLSRITIYLITVGKLDAEAPLRRMDVADSSIPAVEA